MMYMHVRPQSPQRFGGRSSQTQGLGPISKYIWSQVISDSSSRMTLAVMFQVPGQKSTAAG